MLQQTGYPEEEYFHTFPPNSMKTKLIPEFPNTPQDSRSYNI
jgi:hypothetical protein